jgi:Arc/MetJ family transcription regulator
MYFGAMKFTLNIDDALLARVMETTGAKTKTEAIHAALAEVDRRNKLIALLSEGVGEIDWKNAIDENSWADQEVSLKVAEGPTAASTPTKRVPVRYEPKPRSRR